MADQAEGLRQMKGEVDGARRVRVIAITSGKGGVGKTSIATNLAYRFARRGRDVLMIDGDLGLANIEVILGLQPRYHLGHVLRGERAASEVLVTGPGGFRILPASSGVKSLTHLTEEQRVGLVCALDELEDVYDTLILDTGAGIGSNVTFFNAAAQDLIVVVTPEPTALTDAYAMIKVMSRDHGMKRFRLLVNEVDEPAQGPRVYKQLVTVADRFLVDVAIRYQGCVPRDLHVGHAVMAQKLLLERYPESPAALAIARVADDLVRESATAAPPPGTMGFFWRRLLEQSSAGGD